MPSTTLPRRDAVVDLLSSHSRSLHANEIATRLGVPDRLLTGFRRLLDDLAYDGSLVALPGQRFKLAKRTAETRGAQHEGTLSVHPRGFGFVSVAGMADDVFVPPESIGGALHGDRVVVRLTSRSSRGVEGSIASVVERRTTRVAGILRRRGKSTWLEPDDTRLRGPIVLGRATAGRDADGNDGDAAVAEITRFPETTDENPEGRILRVLGAPGEPLVEVAKILVREGIDEEHPPAAVAEAEGYGAEVAADALAGREDLTGFPLPTIDPEDARDHDDAVWVTRDDDGNYRVLVAIADVSHYVRPGTALDAAAMARGNSVYLPDRAIPMLPRALSSNLCSLLPGVVRLCLCVDARLDATGAVRSSRLVEGYMRSAAKLTYPGVARALGLSALPPRSEEAEAMRDDLRVMWELSRLLRARRLRRGALDLDLPEAKVVLDPETGAPLAVQKRAHDPGVKKAYQLIEELMLLANETVARWLLDREVPTVFRVHGPPDEAKLDRFATLCHELDVEFDAEQALDPKRLSTLLRKLETHPQKQILHMLLLRAMKQAQYDVANIGHFGLASAAYLHFTSPIRRYPDLLVHRGVRAALHGKRGDPEETVEHLRESAKVSNERERGAMEVEREVVDLYRCLLMRAHVGEMFEGVVTAIVSSGIFVALDEPFVDVLVRLESLGRDEYQPDDEGLRVVGVRSGDRIALGDRMVVAIEDVAVLRRTVYGKRIASGDEPPEAKRERPRKKTRSTTPPPSSRHPVKARGGPPARKGGGKGGKGGKRGRRG